MNQAIAENRINNLTAFWPCYIREHSHPVNHALHFIGSILGLICLIKTFVTGNLWFIPLGH